VGAREAHLGRARGNREVARRLLAASSGAPPPVAVQWAVTTAFYYSVHCIEAHPATLRHHSSSHDDRYDKMSWAGVLEAVYLAHEQLQQWSEQARYLLRKFDPAFVSNTVIGEYLE
jgi:hypothetical protein